MKRSRLCALSAGLTLAMSVGLPAGPASAQDAAKPAAEGDKPAVDVAALLAKARELGAAKKWAEVRDVGKELVKAEPGNVEGHAWLGVALKNLKKCRDANKSLVKAFPGKGGVPGLARAYAECMGDKGKDTTARAWLAAGREESDGDAALKAAQLFGKSGKNPGATYDAYALADKLGKLPEDALGAYGEAAEKDKKPAEAAKIYDRALGKKPGDKGLLVAAGRVKLALKDPAGADAAAAEILKASPDDADGLILKADAAAARGDGATEEQTLRQALGKQGGNEALKKRFATVLGKQARAKLEAGDAAGAKDKADEALKLDGKSSAASDAMARALWAGGDRAAAGKFLKAVAEAPDGEVSGEGLRLAAEAALDAKDKPRARKLLERAGKQGSASLNATRARLAFAEGDDAGAEKAIAAHLAGSPKDGEAQRLGGDIAYKLGKLKIARARYEAADAAGALPAAGQGKLCEVRVRDGAFDGAKQACGKALGGGADDASVHANLGLAMFRLGDKEGAKKEIGVAAAKGAKDQSTLLVQGLLAEADGKEVEAMAYYDKVLGADPKNVEANAQSGRLLLKRAKYAEAAKRLGTANKADPQNAPIAVALAKAQLGAGRLTDAQRTIKALPEGAVDQPTKLGLDAQVQGGLGNYKKANELYEKALAQKPGDPELLALQGQNYLKLPHYEKAISLLEQAQKADPTRLDVAESLARLYAETGQSDKASQVVQKIEDIEKSEVEQQRKTLDPKDILPMAVDETFKALKEDEEAAAMASLGRGLRELVVSDLSRLPEINVLDRSKEAEEALKAERKKALQQGENLAPGTAPAVGKEQAARFVMSGSYLVTPDGSIQVTLKVQDIATKKTKSGQRIGSKDKYAEQAKGALLDVLVALDIPLTEKERASLERTAGSPNLESFVKAAEAKDAQARGDKRLAAKLFKEAAAADAGNAKALVGLADALKDIGDKNRIAIQEPVTQGPVEDWMPTGLRDSLGSKLSSVKGITVIPRGQVDAIIKERKYLVENRENIDAASLPADEIKELAAKVLLRTSIQGTADGGMVIAADLIDTDDKKLLLGDQVTGRMQEFPQKAAELAVSIAKKLVGEPTDSELAEMQKVQQFDDYKAAMAALARERSAERERKEKESATSGKSLAEIERERAEKEQKDAAERARLAAAAQPSPPPTVTAESRPVSDPGDDVRERTLFLAGVRSAVVADSFDGKGHLGGGLMLSWLASRNRYLNTAWVVDLESTAWTGRRTGAENDVAYYGLGYDVQLPLAWRGNGINVGAELGGGVQQTTCASPQTQAALAAATCTPGTVMHDWMFQLIPHAGLSFAVKGVGLFADAGWRFQIFRDPSKSGEANLNGLLVQGGLRLNLDGKRRDEITSSVDLGYTARVFVPNGNKVYAGYKGALGGLLGHEIWLTGNGDHSSNIKAGMAFTYMSGDRSGVGGLKLYELSFITLVHAFETHHFVNPYLGLRLGVDYISQNDQALFGDLKWGAVAALGTGVDFQLGRSFALRAGASYDAVAQGGSDAAASSLSGYAIEAGALLKF